MGTDEKPDWRPGTWAGVPYFSEEQLISLFKSAAKHDLHPHCHIIADGAAKIVVKAILEMRKAFPDKDIRPAMAHNDVITPEIYPLIAKARAIAVLSYQWCGQPKELIEFQRNLFGPQRFLGLENHGKFFDAKVTVAYGSDWPIDPLNEWANFQVGMTRRMIGEKPDTYPRLDNDRDLTLEEVILSATINASVALGMEKYIGSIEQGKFADLAIIQGDLFKTKPYDIAKTKVLRTIVGGRTVFKAF
jgi:predicted amidohydrolase YtcJ